MKNSLLILALCILFGCESAPEQAKQAHDPRSESSPKAVNKQLKVPYYRYLTGKIGDDIQIEMHLHVRSDSMLDAYYSYQQVGRPLLLSMLSTNRVNGTTELVEYDPDMPLEKEKSGLFVGNFFSKNLIRGTWTNGDGSVVLPFLLNDANPTGAANFDLESFEYQAKDCEGKDYCSVVSISLPVFPSDQQTLFPINEILKKKAMDFVYDGKVDSQITSLDQLVDSMEQWHFAKKEGKNYFHNWHYEVTPSIVYNQHDIISFKLQYYTYEGGAHGLNWDETFTYDIKNGKELAFSHFFPHESTKSLKARALKRLKLVYGGKAESDLQSLGFNYSDAKFELSESFYYAPAGLTLIYAPSQIAPYAMAKVEVFVPF